MSAKSVRTVPPDRHELVRRANVEALFRAVAEHAPVQKSELVQITGLSKPTVLAVMAAMVEEGLVRPVAEADPGSRRGAGRRPVAFEPNPQAAYVVGADLGGTKVSVALGDLSGVALAKVEEATEPEGGMAVVKQIARLAREAAAQAGVPWNRVDAVSVGTPGVQNPDGTIRLADNVGGLDEVRVAASLRRLLRTEVRLENDVNMAAIGEFEQGLAKGCPNFVLLALGTGVGMGVMVDGHLLRGGRGVAGEVAYLPIGGSPDDAGSLRRGTFEVAASGSGVRDLLLGRLGSAGRRGSSSLNPHSSARDVYAAAALGDELAHRVVADHAELVARAVLAVASVVDPELVVMGGGIGSNPVLLAPLRDAVARITPWPIRIESSSLGADAGLIGALHHARRSLPEIESARVSARLQVWGS